MAVEAQHPTRSFSRFQGGIVDHKQFEAFYGFPLHSGAGDAQTLNDMMLSNPGSELTSNLSDSKKRKMNDIRHVPDCYTTPVKKRFVPFSSNALASASGVQHSVEDSTRLQHSTMTSTSGSSPVFSADLISTLQQHNTEIGSFIGQEMERMNAAVTEGMRRHYRSALLLLGQQFQRRLREKEAVLDAVNRENLYLQEKLKQTTAEIQIWFNVAKTNEAIVVELRASLEQALLQNASAAIGKEGYADNEGLSPAVADDAESCCFDDQYGFTRQEASSSYVGSCRRCRQADAYVLVLPCRHLCLCPGCEPAATVCPVCNQVKSRSLLVSLT